MSKNIEMNLKLNTGAYETIYPKTLGSLVDGKVSSAANADSATTATNATTASSCVGNSATASKLFTPRTITTNLASTSGTDFDGSNNVSPGVTGILGVGNGGTGVNSYSSLANNINEFLPKGDITVASGGSGGNGTYVGDGNKARIIKSNIPLRTNWNSDTINFTYVVTFTLFSQGQVTVNGTKFQPQAVVSSTRPMACDTATTKEIDGDTNIFTNVRRTNRRFGYPSLTSFDENYNVDGYFYIDISSIDATNIFNLNGTTYFYSSQILKIA